MADSTAEYCLCGGPDTGELMICCGGCDEWFHRACVDVPKADAINIHKFYCPTCTTKGMRTTMKPRVQSWRQEQSNMPETMAHGAQSDGRQYGTFIDTSSSSTPPSDPDIVKVIIDALPARPWSKARIKRWWEEFNKLELDEDQRSAVIEQTWEVKLKPQFPGDLRLSERDVEHAFLHVCNRRYARVTKARIVRWMVMSKIPPGHGKEWVMAQGSVPKLNVRSAIPPEVLDDGEESIFVDHEEKIEVDDELNSVELDSSKLSVLQRLLQARCGNWKPVGETDFGKYCSREGLDSVQADLTLDLCRWPVVYTHGLLEHWSRLERMMAIPVPGVLVRSMVVDRAMLQRYR